LLASKLSDIGQERGQTTDVAEVHTFQKLRVLAQDFHLLLGGDATEVFLCLLKAQSTRTSGEGFKSLWNAALKAATECGSRTLIGG
jgi:hypothetical protein